MRGRRRLRAAGWMEDCGPSPGRTPGPVLPAAWLDAAWSWTPAQKFPTLTPPDPRLLALRGRVRAGGSRGVSRPRGPAPRLEAAGLLWEQVLWSFPTA